MLKLDFINQHFEQVFEKEKQYPVYYDRELLERLADRDIEEYMEEIMMDQDCDWEADYDGYVGMIEEEELPEDFDRWGLCDDMGYSVAHVAAEYDALPTRFGGYHWAIADNEGWSVAHAAARYVPSFPEKYDFPKRYWELFDEDGVTVAHIFVRCRRLNKIPDYLHHTLLLEDTKGLTVLQEYIEAQDEHYAEYPKFFVDYVVLDMKKSNFFNSLKKFVLSQLKHSFLNIVCENGGMK
jgi:hypothetical protein